MLKRYFPQEDDIHIHLLAEQIDEIEIHLVEQELSTYFSNESLTLSILGCYNESVSSSYQELKESLQIILKKEGILVIYISSESTSNHHLLAHVAAQEYQSQTVFLYENEKEGISYYNTLSTSRYFSSVQKYHHVYEFISSGNYKTALKFMKNELSPEAKKILNLGHSLLSLHVPSDTPFNIVKDVLVKIPDISSSELNYVEHMKKLRKFDQLAFIQYLHNYAEHLYEDNNLIDFVVLMYRLAEELLLFAIGWDIDRYSRDDRSQFMLRYNARYQVPLPERTSRRYYDYFTALKKEKMKIQKKYHPKVKIERNKVEGIELLNKYERYVADLYSFFYSKKVVEFLDLRHNGVSGHGFTDFSKEMFEELCEGESPLEMFRPVLIKVGVLPEHSIFKLVQKASLALLSPELKEKVQ